MTTKQLFDTKKKGTLIVSTYRSGTHFLHDYICDIMGTAQPCDEICNDNTVNELNYLTNDTNGKYKVAILNNKSPQYYLLGDCDLLTHWHVIRLTRNDKVHHFISHWFWRQNFKNKEMVFKDITGFEHHGTDHKIYAGNMPSRVTFDIENVITWLQEQWSMFHIRFDVEIDYAELNNYESYNISWNPNQYNGIGLKDLFENHVEIEQLLNRFTP